MTYQKPVDTKAYILVFCICYDTPVEHQQSFESKWVLLAFIVFAKVLMVSKFDSPTWPLVWGWYRVATLCFTSYLLNAGENHFFKKVGSTNTNHSSMRSEFRKEVAFKELNNVFTLIVEKCNSFKSFRNIIYSHKYIHIIK